jgi:hypothetical protein
MLTHYIDIDGFTRYIQRCDDVDDGGAAGFGICPVRACTHTPYPRGPLAHKLHEYQEVDRACGGCNCCCEQLLIVFDLSARRS